MEFKNLNREEFICEAYKNRTMKTKEMQAKFKISPNDIYKILRKNGIELHGNRLDKEKAKEVVRLYEEGKSYSEINKQTGVCEASINKQLKLAKIKGRRSFPKYDLDEGVLENIDSNEKAQFLGVLYADGTISKVNKLISLRLREDDEEYLKGWKEKLLKTNKPLYKIKSPEFMISPMNKKKYRSKFDTLALDITSKKVHEDAIKIGLIPNKTHKNLPMPDIEDRFKASFILGLFEGDGSIVSNSKSRCLTIACQSNMGRDIKKYFDSIGVFSCLYEREYICIIQISRKGDLIKVYNLFYSDLPAVYMKRKQEKFKTIIDSFFGTPNNPKRSSFLRSTSATSHHEYTKNLMNQSLRK